MDIFTSFILFQMINYLSLLTFPLTNALDFFRRRLIGRIRIEYRYFFFNNNVFETEWVHGTFFKITNDNKAELLF